MKSLFRSALFLATFSVATAAYAQQGSISGTVTDRDGKPMGNAVISIDRKEISQHYEAKTDSKGRYLQNNIDNGNYRITVLQNGIPVAGADNVKVSFGDRLEQSFDLRKQTQPQRVDGEISKEQRDAENLANIETQGAFNAGLTALNAGNYAEAIEQFNLAASRRPNMQVIFVRLGFAYSQARQFNEAAEAYKKASELAPENPSYLYNLGIAACRANRIDECQSAVRKAVDLDPARGEVAFLNMGMLLASGGFFDEAEQAFKRSLAHNDKSAASHYQLGLLYLGKTATMADAIPHFERALQLEPNGPNAATLKQLIEATKGSLPK